MAVVQCGERATMTAVGDEIKGHVILYGWSWYGQAHAKDNAVITDSDGKPLDAMSYETNSAEEPHMFSHPIGTNGVKVATLDSGVIYLYGAFLRK